jgi:hypothetical protein
MPLAFFRNAALAITAALIIGGLGTSLARAAPLPSDECRLANAVIAELFKKYNGRLSAQFVASVKRFVASDCDMDIDFKMVDGTQDKMAFGELRVRLVAYRTGRGSNRSHAPAARSAGHNFAD